MVTNVVMPRLSLTMKEGTVGKWYKKEGDHVEKDEPLVEVVSEKATYDVEAPSSGILRKILVGEGADVPVNEVLGIITDVSEPFLEVEAIYEPPTSMAQPEGHVLASPAAKRLAKEHGIDLQRVRGSGPEKRITEEDVEHAIEQSSGTSLRVKEIINLTGLRKTSAERVSHSFRTAPHSTIMMEVDFSRAATLHQELRVSYTSVLVKIVARALTEHPLINSSIDRDQVRIFDERNVGFAVATDNGLVVPVIHDADKRSFQELDVEIEKLTAKARGGKLAKEEVTGGTFTITNLGIYGVDFFVPIINPPEAAILGIGTIKDRPIVNNGKIEVRSIAVLSLAYDHRIIDGTPAAHFLRRIKDFVENVDAVV